MKFEKKECVSGDYQPLSDVIYHWVWWVLFLYTENEHVTPEMIEKSTVELNINNTNENLF
jgi:hypothetical protein